MSDFDRALQFTLGWEGGYVNHPSDPGGATNRGVTQRVYDAYRQRQNVRERDVRLITEAEVRDIYETQYWVPARCGVLPWPLNAVVFDAAVNSGVTQALKFLQRAAGTTPDGVWGPQTKAAVAAIEPKQLALRVCDQRMAFFRDLIARKPAMEVFRKGWSRRVTALRALIAG